MIDRSLLLRTTLELSAHRLADELRASIRACDCVDFFQRLDREPDQNRLNLHQGAPHENNLPKSDIAY